MYASILSFFKFEKRWKLINEIRDIRMPSTQTYIRTTISFEEFRNKYESLNITKWKDKRNWLIFMTLLHTGIRVSELYQFNKSKINCNKLEIKGKGKKYRVVYIDKFLINNLKSWKPNKVCINKNGTNLTYKEIYTIIKKMSLEFFNKNMTPHDLRRSYATNLNKSSVNIHVIQRILGHSDINTTSSYFQYTDDEILHELSRVI